MLATDVSAPEMEALLCGKSVTLRFDHNAMRQAELYYRWSTLEVLGYYGIVDLATMREARLLQRDGVHQDASLAAVHRSGQQLQAFSDRVVWCV